MTIAASWIRKVNNGEELVFISDSRLCGGHRWDECPKLTTLPGGSFVMAFAGDADYAYPLMMQIRQAMSGYRKIETRAMGISMLNGHVLKHINHLMGSIYDMADPNYVPETEFLFGGYSWEEKRFLVWKYTYDKHHKRFVKNQQGDCVFPNVTGNLVVIGDQRKKFKKELRKHIKQKYETNTVPHAEDMRSINISQHKLNLEFANSVALDMEPFETLCKLLKEAKTGDTIGGAPQMVKSYQYMNSCPVGVYWPYKDVDNDYLNRTILGRKLFDYEDTYYWFIDPETLVSNACHNKPKEQHEEL